MDFDGDRDEDSDTHLAMETTQRLVILKRDLEQI